MSKQINYQLIIEQGIPLIKEWLNKQNENEELKETEDFQELQRVIQEIEQEKDYSNEAYEDIRFVLTPFDELISLKIKRIFNISRMDNYTMFIASRWFDTIDDYINLELGVKRFQGNMTKFHYNPISLTPKTIIFFDHIQTLYVYNNQDMKFENNEGIIGTEIIKNKKFNTWTRYISTIEKWTGLKCREKCFDSNEDDWSKDSSVLNEKIKGKKQLVFLIETEHDTFGYYLNSEINNSLDYCYHETDSKSFLFNLEYHEKYDYEMKFEIIDEQNGGYQLYDVKDYRLIYLGEIILLKKSQCRFSNYFQHDNYFNYHETTNALCSRDDSIMNQKLPERVCFTPKRLLVIQMA